MVNRNSYITGLILIVVMFIICMFIFLDIARTYREESERKCTYEIKGMTGRYCMKHDAEGNIVYYRDDIERKVP